MSSKTVVDVVKSEGDERNYRGLVLGNGLKILLVSDPTTDKAAAALDVNIGHMSDPISGLAHFCEHMLFLGTKKYPDENEYNKYLSQHNGSCNAYTSSDHTNYFFDISPEFLEGALDRFGQFFLEPLFTETATERELNAVHSEHSKNVASDAWRINQLERHLGDPTHDFYKFGTGNLSTLDEIPKSKGINIRDELLKFHKTWYSSNLMTLSVIGKESLDDLENMVNVLFENVENKDVTGPSWPQHPYRPEDNRTLTYIVPVKDIRNLDLLFPIPDISRKHYKGGPGQYLAHLIGHEGKGSLLSELKARKWCNSLVAGEKSGAKGFRFFEVGVDLTVDGVDHINDIISLVFQYLTMLQKEELQHWVFEECRNINEMLFRFKDKERPQSYVQSLANRMQEYALEDVLQGPYMLTEWKPDVINDILSRLTPSNVRVLAIAQKFENIAIDSEPWYGTKHKTEPISNELLGSWETSKPHGKLQFPAKNPFIPTDFALCERDNCDVKMPSVIKDSGLSRVWFKQDDEYLLPKTSINFEIMSPLAYMDPAHATINYLFVQLFKDDINEYLYPAELAGMSYAISNTKYGLSIGVGGYHDKQKTLLEKIFTRFTEYEVDEDRFKILKEAYVRGLQNFKMEQPYSHGSYRNNLLLAQRFWTKEELLAAVEDLPASKIQPFISELFSNIHIECSMFGNLTAERTLEYVKLVEDTLVKGFSSKSLPESQRGKDREFALDPKTSICQTFTNEVHKTSSIETIYQVGVQNTRDNMLVELFIQLINEPCFDTLRTKEQLGYIVFSGTRRSCGTQGVRVIIQSDREPTYLDARIEKFMVSMREFIQEMKEEEFETNKLSLIAKRLEKPKKLSGRAGKYWSEIVSQQYNFNRDEVETDDLRNITKDNIIEFFDTYIDSKSNVRKKVVCYMVPSDTSEIKKEAIPEMDIIPEDVTDIAAFKSSLSLYPLPKAMSNPKDMVRKIE